VKTELALTLGIIGAIAIVIGFVAVRTASYLDRLEAYMVDLFEWGAEREAEPEAKHAKIIWEGEHPFGHNHDFEGNTLEEARDWLLGLFREGEVASCACCGQVVKRYARSISGMMVKALALIAQHELGADSRAVLAHTRQGGGGDHGKLVHWGLLRQGDSGRWVCTDRGLEFLYGRISVPRYVYLYNNTLLGRSEEHITVADCAGEDFSFAALMDPQTGREEPAREAAE
jgi:hypothetical protein